MADGDLVVGQGSVPSYLESMIGRSLELERDIADKDGRRIMMKGSKYEIKDVSAYPNPFCFIVVNDIGGFSIIHITNFLAPKDN